MCRLLIDEFYPETIIWRSNCLGSVLLNHLNSNIVNEEKFPKIKEWKQHKDCFFFIIELYLCFFFFCTSHMKKYHFKVRDENYSKIPQVIVNRWCKQTMPQTNLQRLIICDKLTLGNHARESLYTSLGETFYTSHSW